MRQAEIALIYDYNYWANRQIRNAASRVSDTQYAAPAPFPFSSLRGTLVHMLDAEWSWRKLVQYARLEFDELKEVDFPSLASLDALWESEETAMREFIAGLNDETLDSLVRYTTLEGNRRERPLWHCLYHVANHATQHRSEAAAMLTDYGQSPGELDFTIFMNQRK